MEPETANSTMDRAQMSQHLTNRSDWSRNGGQFEPSELELLSNLVFGRLSSGFPFWLVSRFHTVYKSDPGNDLGQETESSQSTLVLLGAFSEFEHHVQHPIAG